jgi:antitoxin MazE
MNVDTLESAMRIQVRKWGNSASVRIPASIMAAAAIRIDQEVDIREDDGRVVIEPVSGPSFDLDALLARMTPETFPDEVDFGKPVGEEIW